MKVEFTFTGQPIIPIGYRILSPNETLAHGDLFSHFDKPYGWYETSCKGWRIDTVPIRNCKMATYIRKISNVIYPPPIYRPSAISEADLEEMERIAFDKGIKFQKFQPCSVGWEWNINGPCGMFKYGFKTRLEALKTAVEPYLTK